MVNDKGLSVAEARNLVSGAGPHVDWIKLAFGTPLVTAGLREKIGIFQDAGIPVYFGGLLFEAFVIRNQFNDFINLLKEYNISMIEVSDGSIDIPHPEKCGYIEKLAKYGTVLSEVGSKDKDREHITPPYQWINLMKAELGAGASYIVAEARETGNVGLYRDSGEVREGLVQEILTKIPAEKILWEAPRKDQQLYFLTLVGANANLGNINPSEVIALEAMRVGLRGDTFDLYLRK
jgi:phosphosulfolactate synthase